MGADLELWTYRLFTNGSLYLEEVFQKSVAIPSTSTTSGKELTTGPESCFVAEDRGLHSRAAFHRETDVAIKELAERVEEFLASLDPSMEEVPKKFYIAYKISQNIVLYGTP